MKKYLSLIALVGFLFSFVSPAVSEEKKNDVPQEVVFGFFPAGNPDKLKIQASDFAKAIQARLGIPVTVFIAKDYSSLTRAMIAGKVDFAFLTPFVYVDLEKEKKVKVLLKKVWQTDFYFSVIAVLASSKYKRIKDLKGARLSFVDKESTSGYLYPSRELAKSGLSGIDFKSIEFSGSHKNAVLLLDEEKVDAISVFSDDSKGVYTALNQYGREYSKMGSKKYRVLWTSESIPNDPLCVRLSFYDKFPRSTHDVMFNLIEMAEENALEAKWSEILGARSLIPATSRHYDRVREVIKQPEFKF